MSPRVTRINLIAVAVVSAALILYAVTGLLQAFVLDDTYALYAELPRASGLRENKEVTYNGHPVGRVAEVTALPNGARVRMAMNEGVKIPLDVDVVVLRRSPIGEQALDIRPVGRPTAGTMQPVAQDFYAPGATLRISNLVLPPEVQELFETTVRVLAPVDAESTGKLVSELADTVRGRRDDIRGILRDSADLGEAIADEGEDYDRLFSSSRVVNGELAEHRDTLAGLITDLRQATSILTDGRDEFEQLLVTAPPVLTRVGEFVERAQPNIGCALDDFANFNEMSARRQNLVSGSEALRNNQLFWVAFDSATAYDQKGRNWFRVHVESPNPQAPPPESYLPDKRPIRDIRPGGACVSEFGPGAGAATQVSYRPRVPEARITRPSNHRAASATDFANFGGGGDAPVLPAADPAQAWATPPPAAPLAATGGAAAEQFVLGLLLLAVGFAMVRRSASRG